MKKCQTCGNQNADEMRFCLNCGAALPDAPVIVNFGGGAQGGQSNPGTNPYGKSMETQFNKPVFQPPPQQQNYSMVPPPSRGGGKKMMIAIGGVVALFLLILVAGAAIVGYNMMKNKPVAVVSPTPSTSPTASPSASPSPSPTKSSSPTPKPTSSKSASDAKAKFDKVWVDYNVTEDGERGMRIHVKFEVSNMEGVDSYLMIYFQEEDGTELTTTNSLYSKDGKVVAKRALKPGFDVTVYKDLDLFIPYSALNLTKGKYNLKMDVDLADDDQTLIQHLGYHEFQYEKF
jgi:hypothetical protein